MYNVCGHRLWFDQVNVGHIAKKIFVSHKAVHNMHYSLLDLECTVLVSVVISLKVVLSLQGQVQGITQTELTCMKESWNKTSV